MTALSRWQAAIKAAETEIDNDWEKTVAEWGIEATDALQFYEEWREDHASVKDIDDIQWCIMTYTELKKATRGGSRSTASIERRVNSIRCLEMLAQAFEEEGYSLKAMLSYLLYPNDVITVTKRES
jgi:hypothetical protein